MAGNNAFATQGPLPKVKSASINSVQGTNPLSNALNSFNNVPKVIGKGISSGVNQNMTPIPKPATGSFTPAPHPITSGLLQKPTTPVKKVTHNAVDGSSTVVEHHAPEVPSPTETPKPNAGVTGGYTNPINQDQQSRAIANDQAQENRNATVGSMGYDSAHNLNPGTSSQPGYQGTNPQTSYNGLVNNLANQGGSPYNKSATGAIENIGNAAGGNQQYQDRAKQITDKYAGIITPILKNAQGQEIGASTTGTSPVGEGNAAAIASATGQYVQGLTNQENQELTGNAQGLTGQGQQASAYNQQAGQSLTGQSTAQSALNEATGYRTPANSQFSTTPGQTVYNAEGKPIAGGFGGQGNSANALSDLANSVANGSMGYNQAISTMGAYASDPATVLALQNEIKKIKPDFQIAQSNANFENEGEMTKNYQKGLNQLTAANNIEPQIVQTLISNPTLNQTPISSITKLNEWFSGQTSDPAQQQLSSQVASYISALGMTPEQATAIATQKGGTIGALLKTLKANFVAQNEGNNPANLNKSINSTTPTTSKSSSKANPWH